MSVQMRPATADRWSDLVKVFGRRGEDSSWCWCRLFLRSATCETEALRPRPDNRDALRQEITHAAVPPGLLAYVDDQPVGWTRVGPRSDFPRVSGNVGRSPVRPDPARPGDVAAWHHLRRQPAGRGCGRQGGRWRHVRQCPRRRCGTTVPEARFARRDPHPCRASAARRRHPAVPGDGRHRRGPRARRHVASPSHVSNLWYRVLR